MAEGEKNHFRKVTGQARLFFDRFSEIDRDAEGHSGPVFRPPCPSRFTFLVVFFVANCTLSRNEFISVAEG